MVSPSPITLAVLEGYLQCRYFGTLRLTGDRGEPSDYLAATDERRRLVRTAGENEVRDSGARVARQIDLTREALRGGEDMILDAHLICEGQRSEGRWAGF